MSPKSVDFVDGLPRGNGRGKGNRAVWLDELDANPGQWARIPIAPGTVGNTRIRWEPKGYEFAVRDGESYGRFVGVS